MSKMHYQSKKLFNGDLLKASLHTVSD